MNKIIRCSWLTKRFIFIVLLGLIFIPSAKAGCWGPIERIFSVEEFDDVRCKDMSALDISGRPGLIETLTFNPETIWPSQGKMPPGLSPNQIMTNAMNPGLGIRALHAQGITGAGVSVAIIDQAMYLDHPEFAGKVVRYYDLAGGEQRSMHGPAVTSLLIGTNCGTAPGARVYYFACRSWVYEVDYAQALDWIIALNGTLPDSEKIRVVSVSAAPGVVGNPSQPGQVTWDEACERAEAAGILVLYSTGTPDTGLIGICWYDAFDPENVAKCAPGFPWQTPWFNPQTILAPASVRTTAEEVYNGDYSYIYWGAGGLSWSFPYCAGVLAMGWQLHPELTSEQMVDRLFQTAYINPDGAKIINPPEFINLLAASRPVIQLSTKTINFYAFLDDPLPQSRILSISNSGLGTLNWTIDGNCDWLSVTPHTGSSTGENDINNVTLNITDLTPGIHNCKLTISDPCAINNPQIVSVNLYVADHFEPTIQSRIDSAENGDTVILEPGLYMGEGNRDIEFHGKAITVRSLDPSDPDIVASTVIICQGSNTEFQRGFYFKNGENTNSILAGITITNSSSAGAIACNRSSPTIMNCVLVDNSSGIGGGFVNNRSNSTVINCKFSGNSRCGMYNTKSSPTVTNCIFSGNISTMQGGGMRNRSNSNPTLFNCTFSGNSASLGGGIHNDVTSNSTLTNCIFWDNIDNGDNVESAQIHSEGEAPIINYSCIHGLTGNFGGIGNIGADPLFVNASEDDFHLLPNSPCVDTGDPNYPFEPDEMDIDGQPRVFNGQVDMGADEFVPPVEVSMKSTPQTLNCNSKGKWVKSHLLLPKEFLPEDVDVTTPIVARLMEIEIDTDYINLFVNEDNLVEIEVVFSRDKFCSASECYGNVEVSVEGLFVSGQPFYGKDTIKLITCNLKHLTFFVSYWLESGADLEADLNNDGLVNFKDFAVLCNH